MKSKMKSKYIDINLLDYGSKLFAMRLFFDGATQAQNGKIDFETYYNNLVKNHGESNQISTSSDH